MATGTSSETSITPADEASPHDAILIVGFGGPEGREDVIPFLENVLRGRNVPRERLLEVAEHYDHFDGISPINGQVRALIAALKPELKSQGVDLPVYWGNRNWTPMLADTMKQMAVDGVKHVLGVVLAAYSSYSSCRQYREDIQKAREAVGPDAPVVDKMRVFYNHPDFVEVNAERVREALGQFPEGSRGSVHVAFTAHSIPDSMAANCRYVEQLAETCRLVAEAAGVKPGNWSLVYQSRSGRPTDPWLGPSNTSTI
jgi:ferrochelatase